MATTQEMIDIKNASTVTDPSAIDLLGRNSNGLVQIDYNKLAQAIVEQYKTSTLAGSAQSVKSALDGLNSKYTTLNSSLSKNFILRKTYNVDVSSLS